MPLWASAAGHGPKIFNRFDEKCTKRVSQLDSFVPSGDHLFDAFITDPAFHWTDKYPQLTGIPSLLRIVFLPMSLAQTQRLFMLPFLQNCLKA